MNLDPDALVFYRVSDPEGQQQILIAIFTYVENSAFTRLAHGDFFYEKEW
ncbi:MAG TPA: hypothetical protein VHZ74_26930 [Bryobacteraceae bacterium]|nr:hypothetical protein [Bryobacteraceae bacterium]